MKRPRAEHSNTFSSHIPTVCLYQFAPGIFWIVRTDNLGNVSALFLFALSVYEQPCERAVNESVSMRSSANGRRMQHTADTSQKPDYVASTVLQKVRFSTGAYTHITCAGAGWDYADAIRESTCNEWQV